MAAPAELQAALDLLRGLRERHGIDVVTTAQAARSAPAQAAALALRHLLPADLIWHIEGHEVLARLASGDVLVLGLDPSPRVNGRAVREGRLRRATIDEGSARAVFELAAALWSNPKFLPEIEPIGTLMPPPSDALAVPRGMEFVSAMARSDRPLPKVVDEVPTPGWLAPGLLGLAGPRRQAFERTVWNALRFLLLHELGHVCLGHLELGARKQRYRMIEELRIRDGAAPPKAGGLTDEARRALEIEADGFAAARLFGEAHERDASTGLQAGMLSATASALLGAALVPIIFHAMQVFSETPEPLSTHPPLWFRADAMMRAAMPGAGTGALLDAPLRHWAANDALQRPLAAAGHTHPLLGQWLGPVIDGGLDGPARRVLAEARFARDGLLRGRLRVQQQVVPSRGP
ncbi:hypothetical protein [Aquabacterium sp.]|uniref:hypothetical protein n=1 Tax=Aquabacterium sp. TaxID=1872578 RepID=UPI002BF64B3B|nr:hypothetical protein [Aquabacterium sp.]HSW03546.1 hypothetical protein [Aquabacterium sp.]